MNIFSLLRSGSRPQRIWGTLPLTIFVCLTFTQPVLSQEKDKMLRTLTVTGRGVETIPTSLSQVSLGVEVQGKNAREVQEDAARRSSSVVALLKSRNVEKLQTTGITLNPTYNYNNNVQRIVGYAATNTVSFRIVTEKVGELLDDLVKVGATRITRISFVAREEAIAKAQELALKEAAQDAQNQAAAVLKALGFESKEIVNIQINNPRIPPAPIVRSGVALASEGASTPVIGGEQEVEASVTLQISY
ncbi:MAG: SIMPL domain-containing protein [Nostocaceae cyanobacterium]|nr:SIMPL domain-containing protein [Nostocaceae cyanobacterium]